MRAADVLAANGCCDCLPMPSAELRRGAGVEQLAAEGPDRSHLFADTGVLVAQEHLQQMLQLTRLIEQLTMLPHYRRLARTRLDGNEPPSLLRGRGWLIGYDFHLSPAGVHLIEINTNPGGAFLFSQALTNKAVNSARCADAGLADFGHSPASLARLLLDEWRAQGRLGQPRRVAIVDESPKEQYLYPDMCLAAAALNEQGVDALIVAPQELQFERGQLQARGQAVDMVYNRSTDFYLRTSNHRALRQAWHEAATVVAPNPWHHSLYAHKDNLVLLSQSQRLAAMGLDLSTAAPLTAVLPAQFVTEDNAAHLWQERRRWVFKPVSGFGSRGVYRGDKVTKKVWQSIVAGNYLAQALVHAPARVVGSPAQQSLKFDVRLFAAGGEPVLLAARVYQGQVTNFRTPGGGFAPVYLW